MNGKEKSKVLIQFLLIFRQSGDVLFFLYARRLRGYTATQTINLLLSMWSFNFEKEKSDPKVFRNKKSEFNPEKFPSKERLFLLPSLFHCKNKF